jgi:hypothetical protein
MDTPKDSVMAKTTSFKKIDITRAIEAVHAGGLQVARVEIDQASGRIIIVSANDTQNPENDLDKWMKKHAG